MKRFLAILIIALFSHLPQTINAQEHYLKFSEKDIKKINTVVTQSVSIDKLIGDTVFAYANPSELDAIKALGYKVEILPHPTSLIRNRAMATTIEQMSNWDAYPTYEVYRAMMKKFEQDYPSLCKLDSIGTTVQGRKLYVLKISDNVLTNEAEPEFFYTSTMHGDETTGFVLMLRLIDYLLSNYGTDSRVTNLVNSLAIYINPNANPDGTYQGGNSTVSSSTRYNANGYDINRNFPDPRAGSNPNGPHQPETLAMMNFAANRNFALSANFHGGIELVNFPWDTWTSSVNSHADHNWFYTISRQYADFAQANSPAGYFTGENNGVTHGGDWYVVAGGRQDYMNYFHHCREITLEISNTKNPNSSTLPNYWNYNQEAMLSYMELLYAGIHGTVKDEQGNPLSATITIAGHDKDNSHVVTNPLHGNYIRMIAPGTYNVSYLAEGYISQIHALTVSTYTSLVTKDVVLVQAEQTSLSGVVTDFETGNPINGGKIELLNSSISPVFTNSSGQYVFTSIPENTYQIKASKDGYLSQITTQTLIGESNTLNFSLVPSNAESFETGIPQGFTFAGGNWTLDSSESYDGTYSLRSADITHSQQTSVQITLNIATAGEISFARKVSSENNYDFLKFYIDGSEKGSWSGNQDWAEVSFPVTAGSKTFKWEYSKDGSMDNGSDCAWIDFIIFPQSQQSVTFTVKSGTTPIVGAQVEFNQNTLSTNSSGVATFTGVLRGNAKTYVVSKNGFYNSDGTIDVKYVNVNQNVSLAAINYSVTFSVNDGENPIEGATVSINSQQITTNQEGIATISLPNGNYSFTVSKLGYHDYSSNLVVNGEDVNQAITLIEETEPLYTVKFEVTSGENKVVGAVVEFNGNQEITDSNGEAEFINIPQGTYSYVITAEDYITYNNEIDVNSDELIEVTLVPVGIPTHNLSSISLGLWPNPFADYLEIEVRLDVTSNLTIEIYTVSGQKVKTLVNSSFSQGIHSFKWTPTDSPSILVSEGLYIIKVLTSEGVTAKRAIFSPRSR